MYIQQDKAAELYYKAGNVNGQTLLAAQLELKQDYDRAEE